MGDKRRAPARDRAIMAMLDNQAEQHRYGDGLILGQLLDAIPTDVLQELHDERCLQDIDDMLHISSLVELEVDRLERERERMFGRPVAEVVREAAEGTDGDPFDRFPKDGQP